MSLGNRKGGSTYGNKGSGFAYEKHSAQTLTAIEQLLSSILASNILGTEFETSIVTDSTGAEFLEIRIYDMDAQTFGTPTYYTPGSTTPVTPVAPIVYTGGDATEVTLQALLTESLEQGLSLDQIVPSNIDKLKAANDLVTTFVYYTDNGGGDNPSGNKNVLSITYSSAALTAIPDATETFVWDADDDVLSITLS